MTCFYNNLGEDLATGENYDIPSGTSTGDANSPDGSAEPGSVQNANQVGGTGNAPGDPDDNDDCDSCYFPPTGAPGDPPEVDNKGNGTAGDPVNVPTGNMAYHFTDYKAAGPNPFTFTRYFNSRGTFMGTMGSNWRTSYDRYIRIFSSTNTVVERADGKQLNFTLSGSSWVANSDVDYKLTKSGSTWTLTDPNDAVETYTTLSSGPASGYYALLNTIVERNGYTRTMAYSTSASRQPVLSTVTDSYGRVLTLNYTFENLQNLVTSINTPDSTTISYAYSEHTGGTTARLSTATYPTTGSSTQTLTYVYGSTTLFNTLTGVVDENGGTYVTWTYDAYGRALTSTIGTGTTANVTTFTYNDSTGSRTVTNPLGVVDTYSYSTLQSSQKLTGISRAATATTPAMSRTFAYDSNGFINSKTDWNGNSTTYVNNARGAPTTINEAVGSSVARTTTITYDTTWVHLPKTVVTTGVTTGYTYDAHGEQLTKVLTDTTTQTIPYSTNGQTRTWTYTYANALQQTVKTPNLNTTTFGYDTSGALTSITDPFSHVTSITAHTGGGLPLTIVDPNGVTTTKTYDGRQRILTSAVSTTAGTLTTSWQYNNDSSVKVTLPDGSTKTTLVDSAHRNIGVSNTLGEKVSLTLDANGDPTVKEFLNPSSTVEFERTATFDALGRKLDDTSVVTGQSYIRTFDHNGQTLTLKDPLSHTTTNLYDALNRLYKSTDANSGIVQYTFDAHNRPLTVEDKNNHTTTFVYDGFGDAIQQASPDTGTTVYHYDSDGNMTSKTDAASVVTNHTYDAIDRVLTNSYPADSTANVSFTYDQVSAGYGFSIGHLTTATDANGYFEHKFDERGNMLTEARRATGGTLLSATLYTYDNASRILTISYPSSGTIVTYVRDTVGRVTSITVKSPSFPTATTLMSSITYEPFGPVTGDTAFNGDTETFTFDKDYRMLTLVTASTNGSQNQTFAYDNANNLHTITDTVCTSCSATYTYDSINRLLSASSWYGSYAYTYDKNGNFLTNNENGYAGTYTIASTSNRISSISVSGTSYPVSYSANGNITSFTRIPGENTGFTYNVANRMVATTTGTPATYYYDAFGQRYEKEVGSFTSLDLYDQSGHMIEEAASTTGYTDYVFLGDRVVGSFNPTTNTLAFVHGDKLSAATDSTDSTAKISQSFSYTPFQNTSGLYQQSGAATIVQNSRALGQLFDTETYMNHNGFRDYSPALGLYVEADPSGLKGGLNPYAYVGNNPISFTDRMGLESSSAGGSQIIKCVQGCVDVAANDSNTSGMASDVGGNNQFYIPPLPSTGDTAAAQAIQNTNFKQTGSQVADVGDVLQGVAVAAEIIPGGQVPALVLKCTGIFCSAMGGAMQAQPGTSGLDVAGSALAKGLGIDKYIDVYKAGVAMQHLTQQPAQ